MDIIKRFTKLGYEKHSGFSTTDLDNQSITSLYKYIEYQLIVRWLREKHDISVSVTPLLRVGMKDCQFECRVCYKNIYGIKNGYSEALEECLLKVLNRFVSKENEALWI